MRFKNLTLKSFRNFGQIQLKFSPRLNVFIGENGQGKTNLLEALYLSIQAESFRHGDNSTLISKKKNDSLVENSRDNSSAFAIVKSEVIHRDLDFAIQMHLSEKKKTIHLNSKSTSRATLQKQFKAVIFSPESLAIIKEGAAYRRDLIDDLVQSIFPQASESTYRFKKLLRTRNKVLSDIQSDPRPEHFEVLESLQKLFIEEATIVSHLRMEAIREIEKSLNTAMQNISSFQSEQVRIDYRISSESALNWSRQDIHARHLQRAQQLYDAELQSGTSLVGPHKHDVVFLYGENDSRFFCSQGQQRALILAFKMAQIVYHRKVHGEYPVMMLDDVLSELDLEKRQALVQFLHEIPTQTFITTTDLSLPEKFSEQDISVFRIKEGNLCQTSQ